MADLIRRELEPVVAATASVAAVEWRVSEIINTYRGVKLAADPLARAIDVQLRIDQFRIVQGGLGIPDVLIGIAVFHRGNQTGPQDPNGCTVSPGSAGVEITNHRLISRTKTQWQANQYADVWLQSDKQTSVKPHYTALCSTGVSSHGLCQDFFGD
ncbi:hypothetical protein [Nonomuraea jiangxiensis]|uniref:hypothetical protein n=1 Tax=Nonomuraea jiangxiensis TaxID=633440 RepID=UPI0015A3B7BF|nr:hypothetical protein [Nonomuraea jiangxiensis]